MNELIESLRKTREGADAQVALLLAEIRKNSKRFDDLTRERHRILNSTVARDDFIEYVVNEVDRIAEGYSTNLAIHIRNQGCNTAKTVLQHLSVNSETPVSYSPLLQSATGVPSEQVLCFIFGDAIKQAVRKALSETLEWDFPDTIPRKAAEERLAAIDAEMAELDKLLSKQRETAACFGAMASGSTNLAAQMEAAKSLT